MADNRLFLIHQPSGLGVIIGKRHGADLYQKNKDIDEFYKMIAHRSFLEEELDDIVLFNEETNYGEPWEYTMDFVGKFRVFKNKLEISQQ